MAPTGTSERLAQLIERGKAVLLTHTPSPPGMIGFPTLDDGPFSQWKAQCVAHLTLIFGDGHTYVKHFLDNVQGGYRGQVESGIGILRAALEDFPEGRRGQDSRSTPLQELQVLCDRFHLVSRQLRTRRGDRPTLDLLDEYDAQYLMHALLVLRFDDVRSEEYTPSHGGKACRMDFLLKRESVVVELKMTRKGLGVKDLSAQLIEDIERYRSHPGCNTLLCFVYDPDGLLPNPRGLEFDLSRQEPFDVRVCIRP